MTGSKAEDAADQTDPEVAADPPGPETTVTGADRPRWSRGRVIVLAIGGALVVLLGGAYAAAHSMATDTAPRNASVNGVHIGGMSSAEAVATLTAELGPADSAPITVTGQSGQSVEMNPANSGLTVDYAATARQAGVGATWDPRVLIKVFTGGGATNPVVHIDQVLLGDAVEKLAPDFARDPADADLLLEGGEVLRQPMVVGTALNLGPTATAIDKAFQDAVRRPIDGPRDPYQAAADLKLTKPAITDAEADLVAEQLTAALQPIHVTTSQAQAEISPARIAEATTVSNEGAQLTFAVDYLKLYEVATEVVDALTITKPIDATWQLQGGRPVVVPAVDGQSIAPEAFAAAIESVITNPVPREVNLEVTTVPAKFTTAQAEALGIKEVVGEFTTYFANSSYHNTNLGLAAAGINNELVKPGATFSLAEATGPRNASTGYAPGGVLVGDHIEYVVGGGVSQSATTTYNAAFFAGMTDIEHHPHTQYFSQYPPGREATVYEGVLDLRFRNDTPHAVLMEAFIVPSSPSSRGSITVRVWSTKYYDSVRATDPVMYNYTNGRDQVSTRPGCIAQSPSQGFDVSFQRILELNGQTTTEDYFWRYSPIDRIVCEQPG